MLQSMTGYGSNSLQIDELEIYVEIKTLNSRYFDSKISIPSTLSSQELIINNVLKEKLKRGKVDLRIKFMGSSNDSVSFNKSVIKNKNLGIYKFTCKKRPMLKTKNNDSKNINKLYKTNSNIKLNKTKKQNKKI